VDVATEDAETLDLLLDGEPHVLASLPGRSPDAALDLVRDLLRAGVLVPAPQ